jgi:hypothetical protein
MKRFLFNLAAALSLLLSIAAAVALATSYARPLDWRLIATAHSVDLVRMDDGRRTLLFTPAASQPKAPNHGFWDTWWMLSQSGRLTLLAQVIDYEGTLRRVYASPPSLTVEVPDAARPKVVVGERMADFVTRTNWLGFALRSDAEPVDALGAGGLSARVWMVTLPYWFLLLLGLPMPLLWLRGRGRRHG